MTSFHVAGLIAMFFLLCVMTFLWLGYDAPLVDENEQILPEDMPRDIPVTRESLSQ